MIQEAALSILLAHISVISILLIIYILIVELFIFLSDMYTRNQVKVRRANNIIIVLALSYFIYLTIELC